MQLEPTRETISTRRFQRLGLIENPFLSYPDARYFYPCHEHQTLYQEVLRIITEKRKRGIALVRGDAGTGKSVLARRLVGVAFPQGDVDAVGVLLTGDINTPTALVRQVNTILDLPTERTYEGRRDIIKGYAMELSEQGKSLFISIDADLKLDAMTAILEMAEWQNEDGQYLVQTAIFSNSNIFSMEEKRETLTQYVGYRATLGPLTWRSASELVEARVRMAGRFAPLFTDDALEVLIEVSRGIPGNLMKTADRCLQTLIANNEDIITENYVLANNEQL